MYKIQTLNAISPVGLNEFPRANYEIGDAIDAPDAILVRSQVLEAATIAASVKVIGRAGAGVNTIPVAEMTKRGVPVLNTPGANANAVCELVLAGMLAATRNIFPAWQFVNNLKCSADDYDVQIEKNKKQFVGTELRGKTLAVIGLGSIGVKVANAAIGLGMKVIGYDPTITVSRAWELASTVREARNIDEALQSADYITLHVPLVEATRGLINVQKIRLLRKNAVLLNFAREGIVDEKALLAGLNDQQLAMYVTDFPHYSFTNHPQIISLPHLGASTKEAEENCAQMVVRQVREYLENGGIINAVNFPAMDIPRLISGARLCIVNANVPNMVAQISTQIGDAGLNIAELFNKSREDIAYTIVDVNNVVDESRLAMIARIAGVKQIRQLKPSESNSRS